MRKLARHLAAAAGARTGLSTPAQVEAKLEAIARRVEDIAAASAQHGEQLRIATEVLHTLHDEEALNRVRLHDLRRSDEYRPAYEEADPLVSVIIATYDRADLLLERSIPSVLAQTHQNFEIVVVGDAAPAAVGEALASFGDPRIRYYNSSIRGPYPALAEHAWMVVGTPPFNRAMAEARGRWLAPLDDDDSFTPDHIELLLRAARERRLELVYGRLRCRYPDGTEDFIGEFPPQTEFTELRASFGLQAALIHGGLRFMQMHLTDPLFGLNNDVSLSRRMIRAGVLMGMIDEVVSDYYPARVWEPEHPAPMSKSAAPERAPAPPPHWEYVPEGFARPAKGWNVAAISDAYREKWPSYLAAIEGTTPLGVNHEMPRGMDVGFEDLPAHNTIVSYAYVLALAARGRDRISLLDWGGGIGHYLPLSRALLPGVEIDYHCKDVPVLAEHGRELFPEAAFYDDDSCLQRTYDLVLASSSLHYAAEWQATLTGLAGATAGLLYVTRAPVALHAASFVVLQRAHDYGYDTEYLGWVFNREELLSVAAGAGLTLMREFLLSDHIAADGAPEAPVGHRGFLFAR